MTSKIASSELMETNGFGPAVVTNNWYSRFGKRTFDLLISLALCLLLAPVLVTVWLAVRLTSKGPAIFKQLRHGLRGQKFTIYKFRTMYVHQPEATYRQATKHDSRITPIGEFLRKTSIDELPQLLNVLQGHMSLIGPRPHPVRMDEQMGVQIKDYFARYTAKPGVTGLAQVRGFRGETEDLALLRKRVRLDIKYGRDVSFLLDVKILIATFAVVIKMVNAH